MHANIFKRFNLISTDNINLSKTLTSSGTSSFVTSKINLDRKTSLLQSKVLSHIFSDIFKNKNANIFLSIRLIYSKDLHHSQLEDQQLKDFLN